MTGPLPMEQRSPRTRHRLLGLLLAAAAVATVLAPATAGADVIADKRAEASRLASQLEAQGRQISILAERFNQARLKAEDLAAKANKAKSDLAATEAKRDRARVQLRQQAVDAYVRGGSLTAGAPSTAANPGLAARQRSYLEDVLARQREAIDALRQASQDLADNHRALDAARRQAEQALAGVGAARRSAEAANAAERATLAKVRGELATLVAAEAQRRAADEARRQAAAASRNRTASAPTGGSAGNLPASAGAQAAIAEARRQIGKPYQYGASGPNSFDCSGLTMWSWRAGGRSLPHSSSAQWSATSRVSMGDLAPGDLLFYGRPIHHVALYIGNGQMIEASHSGTPVRYASIYRTDYVGAGRVG